MTARWRRLSALLAAVPLAVTGALVTDVGVAQAASGTLGALSTSPTSGVSNSSSTGRPTFSSGMACPAGTASFDAVMNGPSGSGWSNVQALGNSPYDPNANNGMLSTPLADTFAGIASTNSLHIPAGSYTVTLRCLDQFGGVVTGNATGDQVVSFGAASTSTALDNPWHVLVATATTLTVSPATTAPSGSTVTLTAHLTPTNAAGTVQFVDGSTNLGGPVAVSAGTASLSTGALTVGSHTLSAVFTPTDATAFTSSSSSGISYSITQSAATSTTTALAAAPATTAAQGANVTLTATVTPSSAAGTVQFMDGSTSIGAPVTLSSGTASLSSSGLSVGNHSLTATYTPSDPAAFAGSASGPVSYTITGPAPTSTSLAASPSGSALAGSTVTLTATVTPAGAAGTVQFQDGGSHLGAPVTVSGGTAALSTTGLAAGTHSLSAAFTPTDATSYASSTAAALSYVVSQAAPQLGTVTVTSASASDLGATHGVDIDRPQGTTRSSSPSNPGCPSSSSAMTALWTQLSRSDSQPVDQTWSAGLLAMGNTNQNNYAVGSEIVNAPFDNTWAAIANIANVQIVAGHYSVRLDCVDQFGVSQGYFLGDVYFTDPTHWQDTNPATSATPTSTALSVSPLGVADLGTPVTLSASITPAAATGTVQFQNTAVSPAQNLGGPVAVVNGVAQYTTSDLPFGMYDFQAVFTPTSSQQYGASTSATVGYAVRYPAPPTFLVQAHLVGIAMVDRRVWCSATVTQATSLVYSWLLDGRTVASGASYVPTGAQAGHQLACRAVASNLAPTPAVSTSAAAVVARARFRLVSPPSVSGAHVVGYVLTAGHGTWAPTPSRYAYQWLRDGRAIYRATGYRYRFTSADVGHLLSIRVTAMRTGYVSLAAYGPRLRNLIRPTLTGTMHPFHAVTAHVGSWSPAPTSYSVVWTRDGVAIPGATRATYALTSADKGHVIAFRLTARRAYFAPGLATAAGLRCT